MDASNKHSGPLAVPDCWRGGSKGSGERGDAPTHEEVSRLVWIVDHFNHVYKRLRKQHELRADQVPESSARAEGRLGGLDDKSRVDQVPESSARAEGRLGGLDLGVES